MDDQRDYEEEAANRRLLLEAHDEADLVTLVLPMSAAIAADLMGAIAEVAARHGYTDVVLLTDGSNRIVGTPPR